MTTVRNNEVIRNGFNEVIKKGPIDLKKLEAFFASKAQLRQRDNVNFNDADASAVVRRFENDRYQRGLQKIPTVLTTTEDVSTFVKFASSLDDQGGILGIGKNEDGDIAEPGSLTLNNETFLEQAVVDDLTILVNGSRQFNSAEVEKAIIATETTGEPSNTNPPVVPKQEVVVPPAVAVKPPEVVVPASPSEEAKSVEGGQIVYVTKGGVATPYRKLADGSLVPVKPMKVVSIDGVAYEELTDGTLRPITPAREKGKVTESLFRDEDLYRMPPFRNSNYIQIQREIITLYGAA